MSDSISGDEKLAAFHAEMDKLHRQKPRDELIELMVDIVVELEALDVKYPDAYVVQRRLKAIERRLCEVQDLLKKVAEQ